MKLYEPFKLYSRVIQTFFSKTIPDQSSITCPFSYVTYSVPLPRYISTGPLSGEPWVYPLRMYATLSSYDVEQSSLCAYLQDNIGGRVKSIV